MDAYGQEQGPVSSAKLRKNLECGGISQALRVRLPNWDRFFKVEELWPSREAAFVLPPAWPDIYSWRSTDSQWSSAEECGEGKLSSSATIALEPVLLSAQAGGQSPSSGQAEGSQASSAGSAKADVDREIAQLLSTTPWLRRSDFDSMVRQHLHAFHGLGGALQVRAALAEVRKGTEGRSREAVRSWPAYLYKLLKKAFVEAKSTRTDPAAGLGTASSTGA